MFGVFKFSACSELGMSRSVAVVCAYLMRRFEWTPYKALLFIKERRPNAQ